MPTHHARYCPHCGGDTWEPPYPDWIKRTDLPAKEQHIIHLLFRNINTTVSLRALGIKSKHNTMTAIRKAFKELNYPFIIETVFHHGYRLVALEGYTFKDFPMTQVKPSEYTRERYIRQPTKVQV